MAGKRELSLRDLFRFFVRSLGLFIRKHWPSVATLLIAAVAFIFWWPVTAFLIGWLILLLFSFLVNRIIRSLRVRGGTSGQILKVMKIALSERIAFIEQFLL